MQKEWLKKSAVGIVIAVLIILTLTFFIKYWQAQQLLNDPQKKAQSEIAQYVAKLSTFMVLPKETPILATVTDVAKLKNQPFFNSAKNGDKVLIFYAAKQAILYRPSLGKVIDIAPINFSNAATASATTIATGSAATNNTVSTSGSLKK